MKLHFLTAEHAVAWAAARYHGEAFSVRAVIGRLKQRVLVCAGAGDTRVVDDDRTRDDAWMHPWAIRYNY